jgi:hypothetical protein
MPDTYENNPSTSTGSTSAKSASPKAPLSPVSGGATGSATARITSAQTHVCNCRTMTTKATDNNDLVNETLKKFFGNSFTSLPIDRQLATLSNSFRQEKINGVRTNVFKPSLVDINAGSGGKVSAFQSHLTRIYRDTSQSVEDALQALQPVGTNACCPDAEYEGIKKMIRLLFLELGNELQRTLGRNDARIDEIFTLLLGANPTLDGLLLKLSTATNIPSPPKQENEIAAENNLMLLINELAHLRGYWIKRANLEIGLLAERDEIQQHLSVVLSNLQNFIDDCDAINLEEAERATMLTFDSSMSLEELLTWLSETVEFNIPAYLDTNFSEATQTCIDVLESIKSGFSQIDKAILPPSLNNVLDTIDRLIDQLRN